MVSVEKYPCFCGAGLKRFTSKAGRGFVKCNAETCLLFVPEEKYTELFDVYVKKVAAAFKPNSFPLCDCEQVASLWVSHSSSNPSRPYFWCQDNDPDDKCDYFAWADHDGEKKKKKKKSLKRVVQEKNNAGKPKKTGRFKPFKSDDEQ